MIKSHMLWVVAPHPKFPLCQVWCLWVLWRWQTLLFCHVASLDQMIKGTCDLVRASPSPWVSTLPRFLFIDIVEVETKVFNLSRGIMWPCDEYDLWLCGWEPLTLRHHCAKVDAYRSCGNGNITFLFCHMTSWYHMMMCDLVSGRLAT